MPLLRWTCLFDLDEAYDDQRSFDPDSYHISFLAQRDLESFEELNKMLSEHFTEDHLYRIDHYLVRNTKLAPEFWHIRR